MVRWRWSCARHTQVYTQNNKNKKKTRLHEAEPGEGVVAVGEVGHDLLGARPVGQHVEEGHLFIYICFVCVYGRECGV